MPSLIGPEPGTPDPAWVRRSFDRAAARYDAYAQLQRETALALLQRGPATLPAGSTLLDLGSGTGFAAEHLSQRYRHSRLILIDLAESMLRTARCRLAAPRTVSYTCATAEALPIAGASVDLVYSNLAIQWCNHLDRVLNECHRVVRPGGLILLSTLATGTLTELRQAWGRADHHTHVNTFHRVASLRAALNAAKFRDSRVESYTRALVYPDVLTLMRSLKALGAGNKTAARPRHLTGRGTLQRVLDAYPRDADGSIRASFELVFLVARRSA